MAVQCLQKSYPQLGQPALWDNVYKWFYPVLIAMHSQQSSAFNQWDILTVGEDPQITRELKGASQKKYLSLLVPDILWEEASSEQFLASPVTVLNSRHPQEFHQVVLLELLVNKNIPPTTLKSLPAVEELQTDTEEINRGKSDKNLITCTLVSTQKDTHNPKSWVTFHSVDKLRTSCLGGSISNNPEKTLLEVRVGCGGGYIGVLWVRASGRNRRYLLTKES